VPLFGRQTGAKSWWGGNGARYWGEIEATVAGQGTPVFAERSGYRLWSDASCLKEAELDDDG